jgi:hypothetical protein
MLAAPRIGAAPAPACAGDDGPARQRATNTTLAAHGDIDADDICCCGRRPRRAVQLRGARQSMVLKNQS